MAGRRTRHHGIRINAVVEDSERRRHCRDAIREVDLIDQASRRTRVAAGGKHHRIGHGHRTRIVPSRKNNKRRCLQRVQIEHACDLGIVVAHDHVAIVTRQRHPGRSVPSAQHTNLIEGRGIQQQHLIAVLPEGIHSGTSRIRQDVHDLSGEAMDNAALVRRLGVDQEAYRARNPHRRIGRDAERDNGCSGLTAKGAGVHLDGHLRRGRPRGRADLDTARVRRYGEREVRMATTQIIDMKRLCEQAITAVVGEEL